MIYRWHPNDSERLLSAWATYMLSSDNHGYPKSSTLDGNLALLETRNHRNKAVVTAQGKDSHRGRKAFTYIDDEVEAFDRQVMARIKDRSPSRFNVLCLYAQSCSVRTIANVLNISKTVANDMKREALAMVEALI